MRARDIMSAPAVGVRPSSTLDEVATVLAERGFTAVPVVDEHGRLLGVVSEADLLRERFGLHRHHADQDHRPRLTAGEVMTSPVEFVRPETSLTALVKCMVTGRRRTVPVVEGARVVGVVTRRDVVAVMAESDDTIVEGVHRALARSGFPEHWLVRAQAGVVHLFGDDDPARLRELVAVVESVPGVTRVTVSGPKHGRKPVGPVVG